MGDGDLFHITKIVDDMAYSQKGSPFTEVFEYGYSDIPHGWVMITPAKPVVSSKKESSSSINIDPIKFFSSVAEGNCPCNIPRPQCIFHKE